MTQTSPNLGFVETSDLFDYPLTKEDRLESHYFMPWERRRWLNSDMRLRSTPECRAIYFDLICISYEQSPVGTLPVDADMLAKLAMVELGHFNTLCAMPYGPLHNWEKVMCEGEIRLYHPFVLKTLTDAIASKESHRAKSEAANRSKARDRLRKAVTGYSPDMGKNDAAILWIDKWLIETGVAYRSSEWIEKGMGAWAVHMQELRTKQWRGP